MTAWKEQGVTIQLPADDLVLEGVWQAGSRGGGVIAPPHPMYGGSLENPVVNEIAFGLYKCEIPSLRFNWRGVGGSQGEATGDPEAALADYGAALEHLVDTVGAPVAGCGYSFGAAAALRMALADYRVARLLLVAPPLQMMEGLALDELEVPIHALVGGQDQLAPAGPLSELLSPLANARLEVIPGMDHFFASGGLSQISEFVAAAASR